MRVAYFTNQYPAVSHTFIRREIRALETLGVTVDRFALRSGTNLIDAEDLTEAKLTRFILQAGVSEFLTQGIYAFLSRPLTMLSVIRDALEMGWRSDSGVLKHLAYVLEAVVLASWCRRSEIDHLHAHFGTNPAAVAMFASRLGNIPYSFTAHGSEEFLKAPLLSLGTKLRYARFAICVSSFGRSQLMRWSPQSEWHKITVVHCGLDKKFFDQPTKSVPAAARLVCVGRLDENKAQILLVAAAGLLREQGVRCEIVLAGDGVMRKTIEDAIIKNDLQESITITGWVSGERVKSEIEAARALILPSLSENMPVVIMEAMALGRPIISTYIAGIPELVEPGNSGWLVPAGDEVALAEAMREALFAPISQLKEMGETGRRHIMDQHNALVEATKLKRLLERLPDKLSAT